VSATVGGKREQTSGVMTADNPSAGRSAAEEIAERLSMVAHRHFPASNGIGRVTRLTAGATQEIWRFELLQGGGEIPLILRRAPRGEPRTGASSIGLETEAKVLQLAAAEDVPVPAVRYVLKPEDGLGPGFIMQFVEGETLGGRIVRDERYAPVRPKLARQCGQILARIHAIPPERAPELKRSTPAELVAQWRAGYDASDWPRPVFELAFAWLEARLPPPSANLRLVHGDFRNGNLIFRSEGVVAVLDWELAHVGDPMEDLGWICVNPWRFGVVSKPVGGFGEREDLYAGYEAESGEKVDRAQARFWEVFGALRWGVMCAGMTAAFRGADPNVERAVIARRASETEVDLMRMLASD
jgi:aminoglycoside phosphotransferase (APT) family kinase protein